MVMGVSCVYEPVLALHSLTSVAELTLHLKCRILSAKAAQPYNPFCACVLDCIVLDAGRTE